MVVSSGVKAGVLGTCPLGLLRDVSTHQLHPRAAQEEVPLDTLATGWSDPSEVDPRSHRCVRPLFPFTSFHFSTTIKMLII